MSWFERDADYYEEQQETLEETYTKYQRLTDALQPLIEFYELYEQNPLRGIADEFYGLHGEKSIRFSDLKKIRDIVKGVDDEKLSEPERQV